MRAYARAAAPSQREQLIAEHFDMARRIALRVSRRVPSWMSEDDLVASALLGLTEAADRYDATRGEPFVAFAEKRIRGAVLDQLREGDLMSRRTRVAARKVAATIRELEQRFCRPPEDEEVAAALGVSLEEYREELQMLAHVSFVGMDSAATQSNSANQASEVERAQLVKRLKSGLDQIPERDAQILSLSYIEELSYSEIGQVLGVSESRVCQLHGRALVRLREAMGELEE